MRAAGPGPGVGRGSVPAPRRGRGLRRAWASFVDESLFGSPAGARPAPPSFAPPWATAAASPGSGGGDPRLRSKCRVRNRAPSYCDESLFGAKPQGPAWAAPQMRKEDVAKLHPLLWSPPPAPRNQPGLSPRSRETPVRAIHLRVPASPATAGFEGRPKGKSYIWKRPESDLGCEGPGSPGRGRSQSLSQLNASSDGLCLASGNAKRERGKNQSPLTAPATPRGPVMRGRSKSMSGSSSAMSSKAVGGCKPRPPWK
ncbi:RBPJ-interacting and tubulin-associated protein 1 [Phalacrocorax aristotelis]|uniref:RBPJ-interacting and tubulin-associated protein 1 n=1 Tax=Phalacrocorax aristotelis TaxID=126867 RepID=UPI003F4C28F0